jgi:hypothetical protein
MESVNDVWYKQHVVIEFLVAEEEVVGNIHNVFAMFMEVVCLTEALLVAG